MSVIPFIEAMRIAESGSPFNIGFCTADYKRKKAGEYLEYSKVTLKPMDHVKVKDNGMNPTAGIKSDGIAKNLHTRKPRHRQNDTRHLVVAGQNRPLKFHPRLMIMFNSMEVLY